MDIYSTYYMMAALEEMPLEHNFFKNRYFPTDQAMDIFGTAFVLADYKENTLKRAPFVLPRVGALPVGREGFSTATLEPANIAISKPSPSGAASPARTTRRSTRPARCRSSTRRTPPRAMPRL